jgi:hypothetical protein
MNALQMRLVPGAHPLQVGRPGRGAGAQARKEVDEARPVGLGAGRGAEGGERDSRIERRLHGLKGCIGSRRADPGQQLQHAEGGDAIPWVLGEAQHGQHVLDMRGIEELQPAELDERNVAARQLDLQRAAVVRGAEQHRLRLKQRSRLALLQHPLADIIGLLRLVADRHELRLSR